MLLMQIIQVYSSVESCNNRPTRLRFILPSSSHVTILLRGFSIMLLFARMAQICMVRNMLEKSKDVLSRD